MLPELLFRPETLDRIRAGEVTVAFRRWKRPTVKAGGTLTTAAGVLSIDEVEEASLDQLDVQDLRDAGFGSVEELEGALRDASPDRRLYRVRFHRAGDDPRIALREAADLDDSQRSELAERLSAMDRSSRNGAWTAAVLRLIGERPGVRAGDLADELGMERLDLKRRVRRLKALGLTESLEVGYRLSPRGNAFLHRSASGRRS